jgi:hypothetical protein
MNDNESYAPNPQAMLVAWGQSAQNTSLVDAAEAMPLHQKTVDHRP